MGEVLLLDTSAFIVGYEVVDVKLAHYTVPRVRDELTKDELQRLRLENALFRGLIKVTEPSKMYASELEEIVAEMGEGGALSEADKQLLSLGLQFKSEGQEPVIVSDDYSVQNVADRIGVSFRSLVTQGIKRQFRWEIYCPGCRKRFAGPQDGNVCPICGTELKRKPGEKRRLMRDR